MLPKKCVTAFLFLLAAVSEAKAQAEQGPDDCVEYILPPPAETWGGGAWNPIWDFHNLRQNKISGPTGVGGLNLDGNYFFGGMLEYLPDDYDPGNTTIKHPVIIFFHGGASMGVGSYNHLCRLFKDRGADKATHKSLPGRVERNTFAFTQTVGAKTYEYIVVSPQFGTYTRTYPPPTGGNNYPSGNQVEAIIDYVVARYGDKLDLNRIYLTGYSNGANMIMEYAGSSVERAQRVAAVMPVSLCSDITHYSNAGITGENIGLAKLKTWFVNCATDNPCLLSVPTEWVRQINETPGSEAPRFTILNNSNSDPLYQCSDTLSHDAWSRAYDPLFTESFINGSGADDGVDLNMYEWFIQQTNVVLPVRLKSFTARLIDKTVELKWVTTEEKENASFTIERAGADQRYASIATLPGSGNYTGEKEYVYTDNDPLTGLGFYRLVQTDRDGKKTYYDIRKILNREDNHSTVIVSPNPFPSNISAFISVSRSQRVNALLTDMAGKILRRVSGVYAPGNSELKIQSHDLPRGIYLLKVSGEDFNITQKVVKK